MEQNIKQYLNPLVIDHKFCFSLGIRGNFLSYISCINTNNFDEISQMYRTKMIKKTRSNHYKTKLPKLRKNLKHLLNYYPDGLQIEKFSTTYQQFFNHYPDPKNYGYENVIDLLNCPKLQDILTLRKLKNGDVMINSADTTASDVFELELQCCQREIPEDTVKIFKQILESYGGGITVESVVPEYEFRTGKKLDLNEYGVNSIIELLSLLDEDFKVSRGKDNQFYLINSKINQNSDKRDGLSAQNKGDHIETCNGEENTRYPSKEICRRIYHILTEEFPQGLSLQELDATYKGFYGAYSEDLNPLNYGFRTLEALLSQESTQIRLLRQQGKVVAVADILSQEFSWQTSQLAQPKTVSLNICFPTLDTNVFSEKEFTDVVVADVYSPSKFWVIKRGKSHSEALDDLMDRMLSFYDSDMGKRFLIPTGKMVLSLGAPVAALHTEDESFYRAIVISMEDIRTAKLFFVDYGTNLSVPLVSLRLLHPMFFELPAQAIKCSLYGIEPVDKRSTWPKQVTAKFLLLIQDKAFAAYVNKIQDVGKLVLTLYDTSQAEDVNISNFLVSQRMAQYKKGISIDFASTMDQQQSEQSPKQHLQESEKLKCVDEKLSEKSLSLSSIQTSEIKEDMMEHEINPTCLDGPNKFLQKSDVILEKHSTETFKSSCTSLTLPNHSFKTSLENLSKETKVEFPILLFNEREPALRENNIKSKHFLSDHRSSLSLNNIEEKRHCQISSSKSVEGDFSDSLRHTINNNERDCQISSSKSVEGDFRDSFRHTINNNERDTSERGSELSKMGRKWFSLDCGVVISNLKGSRAKDEPECLDNSHHSTKIFFSDEEFEGESSTDSIDYRDTVVSEIEVKYGQVIHLVIKDCSLCVPIPQLLEVFGDTYLDRLEEQALSNSDANHLFETQALEMVPHSRAFNSCDQNDTDCSSDIESKDDNATSSHVPAVVNGKIEAEQESPLPPSRPRSLPSCNRVYEEPLQVKSVSPPSNLAWSKSTVPSFINGNCKIKSPSNSDDQNKESNCTREELNAWSTKIDREDDFVESSLSNCCISDMSSHSTIRPDPSECVTKRATCNGNANLLTHVDTFLKVLEGKRRYMKKYSGCIDSQLESEINQYGRFSSDSETCHSIDDETVISSCPGNGFKSNQSSVHKSPPKNYLLKYPHSRVPEYSPKPYDARPENVTNQMILFSRGGMEHIITDTNKITVNETLKNSYISNENNVSFQHTSPALNYSYPSLVFHPRVSHRIPLPSGWQLFPSTTYGFPLPNLQSPPQNFSSLVRRSSQPCNANRNLLFNYAPSPNIENYRDYHAPYLWNFPLNSDLLK